MTKEDKIDKDTNYRALDDPRVPIDRGWAWVVLLAAFSQLFLLGGLLKTGGIFFVELQKQFSSSSSMTSLINSVQTGAQSLSSLAMMTIGMQFLNCRKSVMMGGLLLSTSYIITAFAGDFYILLFSYGILMGTGAAFVIAPSLVMVGTYFNKRRGIANSITVCGASLGWLIYSQFLTFLFEYYGYTGTCLICAGVLLNLLVSGALLRPITFYTKRIKKRTRKDEKISGSLVRTNEIKRVNSYRKENEMDLSERELFLNKDQDTHNKAINKTIPVLIKNGSRIRSYSTGHESVTANTANHQKLSNHGSHQFSINNIIAAISNSNVAILTSADGLCSSAAELRYSQQKVGSSHSGADDNGEIYEQPCLRKARTTCIKALDCGLWKNPIFVLIMSWNSFIFCGLILTPLYLAPHARDVGVSEQQIGLMFTIMGSIDLFARFFFGIIADTKYANRTVIVSIATGIVGVALQLTHFYNTFASIVVISVIFGVFGGVFFSLFAVILVDLLGLDKLQAALGFSILMNGLAVALVLPVVGAIRDTTGTYVIPFHVIGLLLLLGSALCFLTYILQKRRVQRGETIDIT